MTTVGDNGLYRTVLTYRVGQREDLLNKITIEHLHEGPLGAKDVALWQNALVVAFAELIDNDCYIKRVVTSTYTKDSEPYNPYNLVTQEYNTQGEIANVAEVAPWQFTAHIVRVPLVGRVGRLMVRGAFSDDETIETVNGVEVSAARFASYNTLVQTFWTAIKLQLEQFLGVAVMAGEPLLANNWTIDPATEKPVRDPDYGSTISREVTGLRLKGITLKQVRQ